MKIEPFDTGHGWAVAKDITWQPSTAGIASGSEAANGRYLPDALWDGEFWFHDDVALLFDTQDDAERYIESNRASLDSAVD